MSKIQHLRLFISLLILIFLLTSPTCSVISSAEEIANPYHKLFQIELDELSYVYVNESMPGFETFVRAKEDASSFP